VKLLRAKRKWELLPGPQTEAAQSPAFEILYGGEAGGGKTELIAWLAKNEHHRALVLRRSFPELERTLIPRMLEKYPDPRLYNLANHVWRFPEGKRIELGYLDSDKDVFNYQGAEIDGFFPDELTQFPRDWYLYLFSRIRTTRAGQRMRALATTNPGGEHEAWVKERWGPWLDDSHQRPAKSGEIRWYRRVESSADYAEEEVAADHDSVGCGCDNDRHSHAWSRTFIRAGIKDNPFVGRDYVRNLDMLPEPYRSQLKRGDWNIGNKDSEWQVIPTEWIRLAQQRWKERPRPDVPMSQLGIDVARGGKDFTVKVPRYETWFAEPIKHPGTETPDGMVIAAQVAALGEFGHVIPDGTPVAIDIIGVGASPADILTQNGFNVVPIDARLGSDKKTKGGLRFGNKRAELWWSLREALDPATGSGYALPPGPEVLGDLAAPRWKPTPLGVRVEEKDEIKKRIGRSPDVGDTIVYANAMPSSASGFGVVGAYAEILAQMKAQQE